MSLSLSQRIVNFHRIPRLTSVGRPAALERASERDKRAKRTPNREREGHFSVIAVAVANDSHKRNHIIPEFVSLSSVIVPKTSEVVGRMSTATRLFTLPTSPMKPNVLQPSFKGNSSEAVVSTTNPESGAALKPLVVTAADSTAGNENREVLLRGLGSKGH